MRGIVEQHLSAFKMLMTSLTWLLDMLWREGKKLCVPGLLSFPFSDDVFALREMLKLSISDEIFDTFFGIS